MDWDVPAALGDWSAGGGPLYRRLAAGLAEAIRRGDLGAGLRMPPERELARRLMVSRTTVSAAYRLLRDEGVIESRRGSGTRVTAAAGWAGRPIPSAGILKPIGPPPAGVIDCAASVIPGLDGIPDDLLRLPAADLGDLAAGFSYEPLGLPPLRAEVAARYTRLGLATDPEEVLITTGAQQAIDLLFRLTARGRGGVAVENPTYVGALDAAAAAGLPVVGIQADAQGAVPDSLQHVLDRAAVKLVYLMPSGHNPTGAIMRTVRRQELVRLAAEAGARVIDDMTMADVMSAGGQPLLDTPGGTGTVVTIGSLSKLFWAGLRVGWIRGPRALIGRLARLKALTDLGSSHPSQLLAIRLLPLTEQVAALRRRQLAERRTRFCALLDAQLPDWSWTAPPGGPFLWVQLPYGDAEAFAQLASRHGVRVLAGTKMSADGTCADRLRVSFVSTPADLEAAVQRLASAWAAFDASGAVAGNLSGVVV